MDKGTRNILIAIGVVVLGGGAYLFFTRDKGKKGKGKGLFGKLKGGGKGEDDLAERLHTLITKTPDDSSWWLTWNKIKEEIGDNKDEVREAYFDKYNEYPVVSSRERFDGKGLFHFFIYDFFKE